MWLTLFFWDDIWLFLLQWNKTNTMPLHSQHHTVLSDLQIDKWHSLPIRFFSKIKPTMKSTTHQSLMPWYLLLLGHVVTKIPPLTHFPTLPLVVELHQPVFLHFHWSLRFAAHYKFTTTNYYSKFVILHASWWQNHPVYWLNTARFYCKLFDHLALSCT